MTRGGNFSVCAWQGSDLKWLENSSCFSCNFQNDWLTINELTVDICFLQHVFPPQNASIGRNNALRQWL